MNIFLSGGFRTGWQDQVTDAILAARSDVEVYDPRKFAVHDPALYTQQDLEAIIEADILIVFIERSYKDNQRYLDQAFHVGFAKALNKKVILINQHGAHCGHQLHQLCDVFSDIDGAMAALPFMEEFRLA
jgi:hypothetical protein